jgi:hypothetical protein
LARWAQQIAVAQIFAAAALMAGDAPRSASSEQLLRLGNVVEIHLQIARDGWESLRNDQRGYVRASLSEGGQTYGEVGLRLKGSAGSFRPVDSEKPGFTIKVNQFVRGQRFHGLRKFLLNNAVQDPTYVSESVGNELFRAAGVPAARSCHARVYLNERDLGLYVLFEAISRDFLALNFTNPDGNIYEGPGDVSGEIDADTHGPFLEREDLMMLTHAAEEPNLRERYRRLEEVLDVDRFVTFLVLEALLWHWDGYGVGVNNYRIYSDPSQGRLVFLPHGCDQLLQDPRGSIAPPLQGLVARAFLGTPEGQRLYRKRLGEILDKVFLVERIRPRIQILIAALRPVFASRSPAEADEFEGSAAGFLGRLEERRRSALEQIDDPAGAFGAPLEFDAEGIARPAGWRTKIDQGAAGAVESSGGLARGGGGGSRARRRPAVPRKIPCGRVPWGRGWRGILSNERLAATGAISTQWAFADARRAPAPGAGDQPAPQRGLLPNFQAPAAGESARRRGVAGVSVRLSRQRERAGGRGHGGRGESGRASHGTAARGRGRKGRVGAALCGPADL